MNQSDVEIGRAWRLALAAVPDGATMTLAVTKHQGGNIYIAQMATGEDEASIVQGHPTWAAMYALEGLRKALEAKP